MMKDEPQRWEPLRKIPQLRDPKGELSGSERVKRQVVKGLKPELIPLSQVSDPKSLKSKLLEPV
jgi:hypothetical protein